MRRLLVFLLVLMSALALVPAASAIVWCHDYTLYRIGAGDQNKQGPNQVVTELTKRGYVLAFNILASTTQDLSKPIDRSKVKVHYLPAGSLDSGDAKLRKGDVFVAPAHSGIVRDEAGNLDHFYQTFGESGVVRTIEDVRRQPNCFEGKPNTMLDIVVTARKGANVSDGTNIFGFPVMSTGEGLVHPLMNVAIQVYRKPPADEDATVRIRVIDPDNANTPMEGVKISIVAEGSSKAAAEGVTQPYPQHDYLTLKLPATSKGSPLRYTVTAELAGYEKATLETSFWKDGERDADGDAVANKPLVIRLKKEIDISGQWSVTIFDTHATYEYRWDVSGSAGKWTAQQTLVSTTHPYHKASVGQRGHDYKLTLGPGGVIELEGTGSNSNPKDAGYFKQTGTLRFTRMSMSGTGTHTGSSYTNTLTFSGTRM
ncbi:MAG TPA: hypothetical protein VEX38_03125 [Fimbriimonadaceae bacterium]|nr:hypothetical protein [Fimbriimonadaceae bacterium]